MAAQATGFTPSTRHSTAERGACFQNAAEPAPPGRSRCPLEGVTPQAAPGCFFYPGRFIWQLVGVLEM